MINRDEVLHIAKLARLKLTDQEVADFTTELSRVLDHVEKISELELSEVKPTTHVIEIDGALRPDLPHQSLSHEVALSQAPAADKDGFRVPSPTA